MAATSVPVKRVSRFAVTAFASTELAAGNVVDGMSMLNDGATLLYVSNTGGSPETIDVTIVETVDFQAPSPVTFTISNLNSVDVIGPFPAGIYGNYLEFTVSSASLSFGGFSLL
jgi:hypothetical protein